MSETTLLKRVDGLEIWAVVNGAAQRFAVRLNRRRLRVVHTLEKAEALLAAARRRNRLSRAH